MGSIDIRTVGDICMLFPIPLKVWTVANTATDINNKKCTLNFNKVFYIAVHVKLYPILATRVSC